jgi:hypothetical protein
MLVRRATAALLSGALLAGCAGTHASAQPSETLQAYSRALREGRSAEAYALLSEDAKKTIPFESFKRIAKENSEEVKALAESLQRPSGPPRVTATVSPPGGAPLLLVFEDGEWRIDGTSIDFYSQATPERAVLAFIRAYENRRFDVLLRFVPDSQRQDLTPQSLEKAWTSEQKDDIERLIQALRAALPTARFELLGDRATLAFGTGGTLELVREHGVWKVEDLK